MIEAKRPTEANEAWVGHPSATPALVGDPRGGGGGRSPGVGRVLPGVLSLAWVGWSLLSSRQMLLPPARSGLQVIRRCYANRPQVLVVSYFGNFLAIGLARTLFFPHPKVMRVGLA